MKLLLYSIFAVACLFLLHSSTTVMTAASASVGAGEMPKQCQPGKTAPEAMGWRWRRRTSVRINFVKGNFSLAETEALSRAVNNWNNALREMDTQVVFLIDGEGAPQDGASITVMRGMPRGKERVGEIRFHSLLNGRVRLMLTINPVVRDLGALTSLMTHELGHSLGLADCYECRRGTTAMSAFKGNNQGNDVFEPSACDKYVVAAGYAAQAGAEARVAQIKR